jgi:S1-C subfamily serine protease
MLLLAACTAGRRFAYSATTDVAASDGVVVTLVDLLATGRRLAEDYVATLPADLRERVGQVDAVAVRAAVRITVRDHFTGVGYRQEGGSGVLVAAPVGAPLILSAGHVFDSAAEDRQVTCWTSAGERLSASVLAAVHRSPAEDHAQLRCADAAIPLADPPTTASPQPGTIVIAYGYPDQCGVNPAGQTVRGEAYEGAALSPLRLFLRVVDEDPLRLEPVAGAVPLGGFSGGGLFDLDGHVVGVLTGMSWATSTDATYIEVAGCSVDAMPRF